MKTNSHPKSAGNGAITDGSSRKGYTLSIPETPELHNRCKSFLEKIESPQTTLYLESPWLVYSPAEDQRPFQLFWFEIKICFRGMFFFQ